MKKKPRKNQTPWRTSGRTTQAVRAPGRASLAARALGRASLATRAPSRATQAARPGLCDAGHASSFSPSLIWSPSLWSDSFSLWSDPIRWGWGCAWDLDFFKFFWFINRVLETQFSSGHHVKKDATSDVIRL